MTERAPAFAVIASCLLTSVAPGQWVTRDERWQPRGPWNWSVPRQLPELYREFNGIDFGHAHLAETLLRTQDPERVERARVEVLDFIFSGPRVPPDEDVIGPRFSRMVWELRRTFNWAHTFHRSLYDLFASDVADKEAVYRSLLADYLEKPEAITPMPLDHHGALWSFPESKSFRDTFPKFNVQIWAYHWLQAAVYDVQLIGREGAARQRELLEPLIAHYHGYLREPPLEWEFMPMMHEAAPEFSRRFPEAAAIFDNLHMLHDNVDDVLSRPDLYPTPAAKRAAILKIHEIYLHRNHERGEYTEYHAKKPHATPTTHTTPTTPTTPTDHAGHGEHAPVGEIERPSHAPGGARPPSARDVLHTAGMALPVEGQPKPDEPPAVSHQHGGH